jgi:hypothetical protein
MRRYGTLSIHFFLGLQCILGTLKVSRVTAQFRSIPSPLAQSHRYHDIIAKGVARTLPQTAEPLPTPPASRRSMNDDHDAEMERDELEYVDDTTLPIRNENYGPEEARRTHNTVIRKDHEPMSDASEESDDGNATNASASQRDGTLILRARVNFSADLPRSTREDTHKDRTECTQSCSQTGTWASR